jgi:general secretion pathway protein I
VKLKVMKAIVEINSHSRLMEFAKHTDPFRGRGEFRASSFRHSGFTLLEVLIALVILAIALAAATRASHMATDSALIMKQRLVGSWIAQNHLAELRAKQVWPDAGVKTGEDAQGGMSFTWQETVSSTEDAAFRRVEVKVFSRTDSNYAVATLVGFLNNIK